jgi:trk system potassium uptake protein TrkH
MPHNVPIHRFVARPSGFVLGGLAAGMAACAAVGAIYQAAGRHRAGIDDGSVAEMAVSAGITAVVGFGLVRWGAASADVQMRRTEATLTTTVVWALTSLFGALPFMLDARLPFADAVFEAASGFTTTGATILPDIEGVLSRPLLLWRSLIQWLGGMGIVVLFIAVFPSLGVSGKHMFRTEVPGHSAEGLKPKIGETSWVLWKLYAAITAAQVVAMMAAFTWLVPKTADTPWSENLFDAVCHSLTTISTGGFSTKNASIAYFDSALIDVLVSVFMLVGGANFGLFYGALLFRTRRLERVGWLASARTGLRDTISVFTRSVEFRAYCGIVAIVTALVAVAILPNHGHDPVRALRFALFTVSTTITSTGFGTDNYMAYPSHALALLLGIMFVGGMSGSTAGGIKVSRVVLMAENSWAQLRKSIRPQVVQVTRLGREIVSEDTLNAVATFFFIYMVSLGLGALAITYTDGVPVPTAFGAMLTSLSNVGPAPFYQGADHFSTYTATGKLVFSFAMIIGRLEFFTVFALLLPEMWKR